MGLGKEQMDELREAVLAALDRREGLASLPLELVRVEGGRPSYNFV